MKKSMTVLAASLLALILLPLSMPSLAGADETPERITVSRVRALQDQGEPMIFLDTRRGPDWEASSAMIPGAIRISDNADLAATVGKLPRDGNIVTYCS